MEACPQLGWRACFACTLGGADGRTLFMMAARFPIMMDGTDGPTGQVLTVEALASGAGWP